ncbi:putative protein EIN4-like [Capsicum annuum]|nr:putative protein EIN4-like [Capsicum annuum]KAF3662067.1 putative protein EIN4-like [Capsicum annuum]
MLEIQQDIKDEIHVCLQRKILKFTMLEFAIITDLKCIDDIDEFMYTSSSKSPLMSKYFPESGGGITRVAKQLYSLGGMPYALNVWVFECCSECSFNNVQPTSEEVRTLDLSFSEDFVVFDPISVASTSVAATLKRSSDEDQSRVVTADDDYDDFTTRPTQEFLRKARLATPLSTKQPSKRRRIVMFQEVDKKIVELKTLISNIPVEVVKALKKEENKESSYKDEDKGPIIEISNDELSILIPLETEIQDCIHIHTECPTITEAELIPDKEQAGLKDLGKEHGPVMDEHNAITEAGCNEELNIQHSPDMKQSEDDVDDIITESVQDVVEALLFDSHIPPDFPDAQVREIEAAKTRETKTLPVKRDRKKLKVFRSPYITKFGSSSKSKGSSANEEKQMKQIVNHYLKNAPGLGYPLLDFVVTQALSKNWFYLIPQHNTCWNDEISTQEDYTESVIVASDEIAIPNIINGFCIPAGLPWHLVDEVYVSVNCGKEYHWVLTVIVLKERVIRVYDSLSSKRKSEPPTEIRKLAAMLPTYLSDSNFFEKTVRIDWSTLKAYEGKLGLQNGEISHNSFDVEYVQNIPQQASDSL